MQTTRAPHPIRSLLAGITGVFAVFSLFSCGIGKQASAIESVTMSATILNTDGGSLLVESDSPDGRFSFSASEAKLTGTDGGSIALSELKEGQIVSITWDGYILETYPGQLRNISAVSITGLQPDDWVNPLSLEPQSTGSKSPYDGLPSLQLEYRDSQTVSCLNTAHGTATWYAGGSGICADSPHPLEWSEDRIPFIRLSADVKEARFIWSSEPESFIIRRWDWESRGDTGAYEDYQKEELIDGLLTLPTKGSYLYEAVAKWPEGDVCFAFAVK